MNTILVVDDSPAGRYVTVRVLERAGFDVREAATAHHGLQLLRLDPDLVVLDLNLPDMDGFELTRRIKSRTVGLPVPVLHKTAVYRDDDHRKRGLEAGADDYLCDPVEPQILVDTVRKLMLMRKSRN